MPQPKLHFSPEAREAAARELMKLADRMFHGGQSLTSKAIKLIEGDPTKDSTIMAAITRYQNDVMPAADEVARIEAILRGVPPEQCLSEAEKRKRDKDRMKQESHERSLWPDGQEWQEFCAWRGERFWAEREKTERKPEVTEDGVIQGPWGTA